MPKSSFGTSAYEFATSKTGQAILRHVGKRIADQVTGGTKKKQKTDEKNSGGGSGFLTSNYDESRIYKKKRPSKKRRPFVNLLVRSTK